MKLTFLGTGAADWFAPIQSGEYRRYTSTQVDDALILDYTHTVADLVARPDDVQAVLITHSHRDHFDPKAIAALAPARLYAHESWARSIEIPGVKIIPVAIGQPFEEAGYTISPLPANHTTERPEEIAVHYLLEKENTRLLYATDGAWMLKRAIALLGEKPLDAIVIDATIGDGRDGDYRVFEHNSLPMLRMMADTWRQTGRLKKDGAIYLTHMARTLHPDHAALAASLEAPFIAAYDGMEAIL